MSLQYDDYLKEHLTNVQKGLNWMNDNLDVDRDIRSAIGEAIWRNHDESKYGAKEYHAYDAYFYGGNRSYNVVNDFNYAWLHHIHNNPHHWQYWVLINDDEKDGTVALEMPKTYVAEMIADWWTFSWKTGKLSDIFKWYDSHKDRIVMHKNTKKLVEDILDKIETKLIDTCCLKENWRDEIKEETIEHSGVKGQKWGVKNGPPYPINSNLKNDTPAKVDEIKNYTGKLYWLSEDDMDGKTLIPRVPKNYFTENDYEDNQTPRLCFAPSVEQCLTALSQNVTGKTYIVHEPEEIPSSVWKPNKGAVPDSEVTGELWIKEPTKLKAVGRITVTGDDGKDGMPFEYGDGKSAELYGWNFEWDDHLEHHGILGQKWGVRRFQNPDGTRTNLGKAKEHEHTVFISGSSKTQFEDSEYYRPELNKGIKDEIDRHMKAGDKIIVGDAPGIDRQVQDYLNKANYDNVEIYGPGKQVRYSANEKWKTNPIDAPEFEEGSKEWLAKKDKAMTEAADEGLAVILDEGAKATRNNVQRLIEASKDVKVFELNKSGSDYDKWVDELNDILKHSDDEDEEDEHKYGVPDLKKFPMPDAKHVRSAIRFFNYIDPKHEKELAEAILERMKEYDMSFEDFGVGDENRFKNYIPKKDKEEYLEHELIYNEEYNCYHFSAENDEHIEHQHIIENKE